MSSPTPFAYGPSGRWLTTTNGHEVFVCDGGDEHTTNRWLVQLGFEPTEIAAVRAAPLTSAAPVPPTPAPAAEQVVDWGASPATGAAPPSSGMLLYAVGLLVGAALLGTTAVLGWYDDPFFAWLGAGILGISGASILAASRRA